MPKGRGIRGEYLMKVTSHFTQREYDDCDAISILNPLQAAKFFKHGATVYDQFLSHDQTKWVYVFSKKEVAPLKELWDKRELD